MPRPKGVPASEAQRAAGRANLAKGRQRKKEIAEQAYADELPPRSERWAMLLSGTIKVSDLDDEEIARGSVRARDGTFSGSKQRMSSHLMREFREEYNRRTVGKLKNALPRLIDSLVEMAENPDAKDADKRAAIAMALDRVLGKAPERIVVEHSSEFDDMLGAVANWETDRETELADDIDQ